MKKYKKKYYKLSISMDIAAENKLISIDALHLY